MAKEKPYPTKAVIWGGVLGVGSALFVAWWWTRKPTAPGKTGSTPPKLENTRDNITVRFVVGYDPGIKDFIIIPEVAIIAAPGYSAFKVEGPSTPKFNLNLAHAILRRYRPGMKVLLQDTRNISGHRIWTDQGQAALTRDLVEYSGLPDTTFEWVDLP